MTTHQQWQWSSRIRSLSNTLINNDDDHPSNLPIDLTPANDHTNQDINSNVYKPTLTHITCLQSNLQSISNKFPELASLVDHHHPKIIGITESWCNENIQDAEIKLNDYSVYRRDRQSGKGGGVILYIHNSLHSLPCVAFNSLEISDSTWCTIHLSNSDILLVGLIY